MYDGLYMGSVKKDNEDVRFQFMHRWRAWKIPLDQQVIWIKDYFGLDVDVLKHCEEFTIFQVKNSICGFDIRD